MDDFIGEHMHCLAACILWHSRLVPWVLKACTRPVLVNQIHFDTERSVSCSMFRGDGAIAMASCTCVVGWTASASLMSPMNNKLSVTKWPSNFAGLAGTGKKPRFCSLFMQHEIAVRVNSHNQKRRTMWNAKWPCVFARLYARISLQSLSRTLCGKMLIVAVWTIDWWHLGLHLGLLRFVIIADLYKYGYIVRDSTYFSFSATRFYS